MFKFKTIKIDNNNYLVKSQNSKLSILGVLHEGKYKTTISIPPIDSNIESVLLDDKGINAAGYLSAKSSSLKLINSNTMLDMGFLLDEASFVQNIEIAKNIVHYACDRNKALIIFEKDGQFKKVLQDNNYEFEYYNSKNLAINYGDLNEKIILDTLHLSNKEQSILASFINFKEANKENTTKGLAVLDGSNWLYDLFIVEPATLAQQFKISEYSVKMLKTSLLKFSKNSILSTTNSNVNEIVKQYHNNKIILIDIPDEDKKLVKSVLTSNSTSDLIIVDDIYHKIDKVQYLLYNNPPYENNIKDFKNFIINKHSKSISNQITGTSFFKDEFDYLDFEYFLVKENAMPLIITNQKYESTNRMAQKIKVSATSANNNTPSFF